MSLGIYPRKQDVGGGLGEILRGADAGEVLEDPDAQDDRSDRDPQRSDAVQHQLMMNAVL
jgi:hypothetical protein